MHFWHHYVALGDSFTQGVGDSVEGFARLGVADRLAAALRHNNPDFQYTNLAAQGLLVSEIRERQLDPALRLKPDIVSVVAGANDIMTGRFSVTRWEEEFRMMYQALTQAGAAVIAATLPDFPILRTLAGPLQARVRGNLVRGNDLIRRLATEYHAILVDAWAISTRSGEEDWSADGVHLNSRGYFKFAQETLKIVEQSTGLKIGEIAMP